MRPHIHAYSPGRWPLACVVVVTLGWLAIEVLHGYELNVLVLRPWQRRTYDVALLAAGLALGWVILRG